MPPSLRHRPSASMVVASAALVVAATGGAFAAAQQINGNTILPGTIGPTRLANGAATTPKIANRAVTTAKIADGAVTSTQIRDASIRLGDLTSSARGTVAVRLVTRNIPINTVQSITARCDEGEVAVSGGFGGLPATFQSSGTQSVVNASRPDPFAQGSRPTGWFITVENRGRTQGQVTAYALCFRRS